MTTESIAVALDAIWTRYRNKTLAYTYAVQEVRRVADVTVVGAKDLLDSDVRPSARYIASAGEAS
jgi:hypothetical protein